MTDLYNNYPVYRQRNPLVDIGILLILLFVGIFLGYLAGLAFLNFDIETVQEVSLNPEGNPNSRNILLLLQALSAIGGFIVAPLFFLRFVANQPLSSLNDNKYILLIPALLCAFLIVAFMPFNALFIEWNSKMDLPAWMEGIESWMQGKEESLKELTALLTNFDTVPQLLIGLLVIALIPAVGEELVFRGIIQQRLLSLTRNVHVAIWLTGLFFSAFHMQFYGLIPRMLLGVLLGYIYVWSGNLWYPIIGHFINNGFTLLMIFLHNRKTTDIDIESTASVSIGTAILSGVITVSILLVLKRYYFKEETSTA
jgi:membrane protease YdiL (CAAX protease family)